MNDTVKSILWDARLRYEQAAQKLEREIAEAENRIASMGLEHAQIISRLTEIDAELEGSE